MTADCLPASVIMACHNAAAHMGEAIVSILAQTVSDLELLVVDDGSTDDTRQIALGYAAQDARVRVLATPERSGSGAARNLAIDAARGSGCTSWTQTTWR